MPQSISKRTEVVKRVKILKIRLLDKIMNHTNACSSEFLRLGFEVFCFFIRDSR